MSSPLPQHDAPDGQPAAQPDIGLARVRRRVRYPLFFWSLVAFSLVAVILGAWLLVNQGQAASGEGSVPKPEAQAPQPATDFQLTTIDGRKVRLSELRGQVVLLNFWATWCPPCKAEMPDLQALYREYADQRNFVVLGVDVEEDKATTEAFARQYGLTIPLLPDSDGKVSNSLYLVRSLPTSYIIDRTGNVRFRWSGQQSRNAMLGMLKQVW